MWQCFDAIQANVHIYHALIVMWCCQGLKIAWLLKKILEIWIQIWKPVQVSPVSGNSSLMRVTAHDGMLLQPVHTCASPACQEKQHVLGGFMHIILTRVCVYVCIYTVYVCIYIIHCNLYLGTMHSCQIEISNTDKACLGSVTFVTSLQQTFSLGERFVQWPQVHLLKI